MTSVPSLLRALASLPPLQRERASQLVLGDGSAEVVFHGQSESVSGPIRADVALDEQLLELEDSGLVGGVVRSGAIVTLWSADKDERGRWERRQDLVDRHPETEEVLANRGRQRLAEYHATRARRDALAGVRRALGAGVGSKATLADLAGVSRTTVYEALKDAPAGEEGTPASVPGDPSPAPTPPAPTPSGSTTGASPAVQSHRRPAGQLVRMPTGHEEPCVVCSTPAFSTYGEVAVHPAECLNLYLEGAGRESSPTENTPTAPAATPDSSPARPTPKPAPEQPAPARREKRSNGEGRFAALAAVLDAESLYLPDGSTHSWSAEHLGEVAALVSEHRLGWGGGKTRPLRGEIWLTASAVERLGLPVDVGLTKDGFRPERLKEAREAFTRLNVEPAVSEAIAAGWQLREGVDHVEPRTRIKHPELLPHAAELVFLPWTATEGVALFEGALENPHELASRAQELASRLGIGWRISDGSTLLDLIDHTRRPRDPSESLQESTATRSVRFRVPGEEPPFLRGGNADTRFAQIERDFSFWREWESLDEETRGLPYVHVFDHGSHYLNPFTSTRLGVEGLEELTGAAAEWDGTESPAYYLVDRWEWPHWNLPDPLATGGGFIEDGKVWVTSHTLQQLTKVDGDIPSTLTYHKAYRWQHHVAYLERAGRLLKAARADGSDPVADTVKAMYSAGVQKFAATESDPNYHLWRPSWRDMLVGAARTALFSQMVSIQKNPRRPMVERIPLVVARDSIIFASSEPDPEKAWPGDPGKLGRGAGQYHWSGTTALAEWGPEALARRGGMWRYESYMRLLDQTPPPLSEA